MTEGEAVGIVGAMGPVPRAPWKVVAAAVLSTGLGLAARVPIWSAIGDVAPYITFFPAVALSSWYGGLRGGLMTTVLAALVSDLLFLEPIGSLAISDRRHGVSLLVFVLVGLMISWITHERVQAVARLREAHEGEHAARRAAQEAAQRMQQLYEEAEHLRREAEAASRAKDEFLAMLGHELRNPLAPMVTAIELMRARGGGQLGREAQVIARQVQHLCRMVDDLLDVSRITRGMVTIAKRPVDLGPILARAVEMASPLLESRQHHLDVDVPQGGLHLDGDPDRLAQVFANLLANAAKYTDPGGRIELSAAREGEELVVAVRDNGVGMTPELLARVFDLFVQGAQGPERSAGGLGIGLALVKSLVTMHGGDVEARSEGPGKGSEIIVRLPASAAAPAEGAAPHRAPARPASAPRRVLVVDDNEDAADLLADALRGEGWEVAVAVDGPQALSLLSSFQPEVAVLDLGLPVMDGYELAAQIRERLGPRAPRLLALTGYGQDRDRKASEAAGFERHLVKPVRAEELVAAIAEPGAAGEPTAPAAAQP